MIALSVAQIAEITGATPDADSAALDMGAMVTGPVVADSRQARPGSLFAALPGRRADGHDFASRALAAGAPGVRASRPPGVPPPSAPAWAAPLAALARALVDRAAGLGTGGRRGPRAVAGTLPGCARSRRPGWAPSCA